MKFQWFQFICFLFISLLVFFFVQRKFNLEFLESSSNQAIYIKWKSDWVNWNNVLQFRDIERAFFSSVRTIWTTYLTHLLPSVPTCCCKCWRVLEGIEINGNIDTKWVNPPGSCMLRGNYRNTRTSYEIYSKLTIKTPKRRQRHRSGAFIVICEF